MQSVSATESASYRADLLELLRNARKEGLAVNYRSTRPIYLCRLPPLDPITDIREPFTFSCEDSLSQYPQYPLPNEKLIINTDAATLIAETLHLAAEGYKECEKALCEDFRHSAKLRLEEPLVRGDFYTPHIGKNGNPQPIPVNEENDGGLTWSRSVRRDVAEFEKKMQVERLEMPLEICVFLQRTCAKSREVNVDEQLAEHKRNRRNLMGPLTPPLLPFSSIKTPELPPLRDLTDLELMDAGSNAELLEELTEPLILEDSLLKTPVSSPSRYVLKEVSTPPPTKRPPLPEDLMLEVPLTPPASAAKRVRLNSILGTNIHLPPSPLLLLPPEITAEEEPTTERLFEAIARGDAVQLEREIAQEQLQQAGSALHVEVPVVDFSLPKPPWETTQEDLKRLRNLSWAGSAGREWDGLKSIDIRLRWTPFTREEVSFPTEHIEDREEGIVGGFLITIDRGEAAEMELMDPIRTLRLRDDDELKDGVFENVGLSEKNFAQEGQDKDTMKMVKGRKRKQAHSLEDVLRTKTKKKKKRPSEHGTRSKFSAASSLDDFIALRARKLEPAGTEPKVDAGHKLSRHTTTASQSAKIPPKSALEQTLIQNTYIFPVPKLPSHLPPADFIVSTILLSQRTLFKKIKDLYPAARLIERDFSSQIFTGSTVSTNDADLILSPKTGLIITTLQKLQQLSSLPDEKTDFSSGADIKRRIIAVCSKYERLLVIIHTGPHAMTKSESEVVTGFSGFAAALGGECIIVMRVVAGSEDDVAKWIVGAMSEHGHKLLEDETVWEQFLRKAGFNAFAAQVVLRGCKGEGRSAGLGQFLMMTEEEKGVKFKGVVGVRVLRKILRVLENVWGDS